MTGMTGYSLISVMALCCYLLLLVAFLASRKTKLINNFILLLFILTAWTLGSYMLRLRMAPGPSFWFYISIDALFMMSYGYYSFLAAYTDAPHSKLRYVWLIGDLSIIVINTLTNGLFIAAPEVIVSDTGIRFLYHTNWPIMIPYAFTLLVMVDCFRLMINYIRKNNMVRMQIYPILVGILALLIGNAAASLPVFSSFPIDILSGIINAVCIFFALYNRRLFRLTLLVSRSSLYLISAILAVVLFTNMAGQDSAELLDLFRVFGNYAIIAVAITYTLCVLLLYYLLKKFVDKVFIRAELAQADDLKEFSRAISQTLKADEILAQLIDIIEKSVHPEKTYICLKDVSDSTYSVTTSSSPLDDKSFFLRSDNPLITWLSRTKDCVMIDDLKRSPIYKAMWEKEKFQLSQLDIQCILPLVNEEELIGLALLSGKEKHGVYTIQDQTYLQSLASVSSIAIKNSRLYEKAYHEARTDNLTGLLNRKYFYETLREIYNKDPGKELALLYISVDSFKLYNKLYGTLEGDSALQNVARIISATIGSNGIAARYEGKTFMVILPGYDTLTAVNLSNTIRKQIMDMNRQAKDYSIKMLTASCGVCAIPTGAATIEQLIANADLALYNAKRSGKNCTRTYSEGPVSDMQKAENDPARNATELFDQTAFEQYEIAINSLTKAIDIKDHFTYGHSQNVCYYAVEITRAYGLDENYVEIVREAALLHDIGKIGIDEKILRKPDFLTKEEYAIMKGHVEQSIEIIKQLPSLSYVIPAVIGHHERYDGSGYPRGLKGDEIPLLARVLCICDSFDAMVSKRIYKDACSTEYALEELIRGSGSQFDPDLAPFFVKLVKDGTITVQRND